MTTLNHLPATVPLERVVEALRRDSYVIIDDLVSPQLMDALEAELDPFVDASPVGSEAHLGTMTRRTGALVARSPLSHELIRHPTILGAVRAFLDHASAYQLMLTQVISIYPGEKAQGLHQDENAWDYFPFPPDYHVQCNTLWALSDYTTEMGATRIVPGSHLHGAPTEFTDADCLQAEMSRGSVLLYSGKIWHSGGANRSDRVRKAININYAVGWVRQEENQYLACPPDVAKNLDDDMLRLIGYQQGAYAMGYYRDVEDPIIAVRGDGYSDKPGADVSAINPRAKAALDKLIASKTA
ncbi:phytanoyl-CoA dioxygenase family protein [Mycolicibacterium hodleri]|uniref:Phytanoyl-CoA dioxygenase family protein n=1 Tax=Mycolicibacterium hodleri TaxID=49897 RepID=A0A502EJP7_9MYCO|nr:phytanoyl-CoA dioxygenase family protein [Mycolicibacterium hodleri]TPG36726.1 phytanoyl-CoA dioxygenase family protein [Mycolicibacterium hodleri]